jgi:hypothetical protein
MPRVQESSEPAKILFCPFCRDGFEGRTECPEHELVLIAIDDLPPKLGRTLDSVTFFADPRLGRGGVLLGAVLVLLGFLAPFVHNSGERYSGGALAGERYYTLAASALEVAIDGAGNLWFTPGAAVALLWILWRRRRRSAMRAARVAVFGLAVGGGLPLIYTTRRIGLMADAQAAQVEWLWGLWVMVAGLLVVAFSSRRFGD